MNSTPQPAPPRQYAPRQEAPPPALTLDLKTVATLLVAVMASGAGGTYIGSTSMAQDPGVIVTRLDAVEAQLGNLREEQRQFSVRLQESTAERWRESDMREWISSAHAPLARRVEEHVALPGHSTMMRVIDRLEDEQRTMDTRLQRLERTILQDTP